VAFQGGGQYTLSLRGKLQLTEAVPLSGTVEPVNFWVKDGKDVKIVFEKLQVKGEIKAVSFDVSVSAQFQDENNLEFIGEGDLTIAKKLGVGVKAGFGRDNGTGYGFLWANYRAPDTSVKPLATVGAFGFYEFHGGLAINMSWLDGNFDVPPTKAIPKSGVTVALQAGTVFGPWIDKGSTAHFKGTLGIDTAGTVSVVAQAWFLTPLEEGAFGSQTPNASDRRRADRAERAPGEPQRRILPGAGLRRAGDRNGARAGLQQEPRAVLCRHHGAARVRRGLHALFRRWPARVPGHERESDRGPSAGAGHLCAEQPGPCGQRSVSAHEGKRPGDQRLPDVRQ
jgi:hypothetical protein